MNMICQIIQLSLVPLDIVRWLWHTLAPDVLVPIYNLHGKLALVTGAGTTTRYMLVKGRVPLDFCNLIYSMFIWWRLEFSCVHTQAVDSELWWPRSSQLAAASSSSGTWTQRDSRRRSRRSRRVAALRTSLW